MYNRLVIARNLLTEDGALVCAIDHNEQENLGVLLRELFGEKEITAVTVVHNPRGIQGDNFSYTNEFAYFIFPKGKYIAPTPREESEFEWENLRNWGGESERKYGWSMFYPLFFKDGELIDIGDTPAEDFHPEPFIERDGIVEIWPIDNTPTERKWRYSKESLNEIRHKVRLIKIRSRGQEYYQAQLLKDEDRPRTVWNASRYDASIYGTQLLSEIIDAKFPFPKSVWTVFDCLDAIVKNRKDATVLDFFAGSATTGHSLLELNKRDAGRRSLILCTNNENEICADVTYPRMKNVIQGYTFRKKTREEIFNRKLTPSNVAKGLGSQLDAAKDEFADQFEEFETKIQDNSISIFGVQDKDSEHEGFGGNLKFFRTSFVSNLLNKDQFRIDITNECTEMLCLREGVYRLLKEGEDWKLFEKGNRFLGVYYNFASGTLDKLRDEMNALEGEKVLYCFSADPQGLHQDDFADWDNVRLEPIPQKILDVYKQLFEDE